MRREAARELKTELYRSLPEPDGRVAVGVCVLGPGSFGVAVRYSGESAAVREVVAHARALAGAECDIRDVGPVWPLRWDPASLQGRVRPLRPGVSVGHLSVTAGTAGAFVEPDDGAGQTHILSNNHVLAASGQGRAGDPVIQPGVADGGTNPADQVGLLDRVVPLRPGGGNVVDAATARLDDGVEVEPAHPAGMLTGWTDADDDIAVEKVGRTTGLTRGSVTAIELDGLTVEFPGGLVTFEGQIEVSGDGSAPFSAGGDSGSVVYRPETREAVGLLFAGSERGGPYGSGLTYCNPIGAVLDALQVRLVGETAGETDDVAREQARAAKDELAAHLRDDRRVSGVGIVRWHGRYAVRVNVTDEHDRPAVPDRVRGVEVRVVAVGRVRPLGTE